MTVNPAYYAKMSEVLEQLVIEHRQGVIYWTFLAFCGICLCYRKTGITMESIVEELYYGNFIPSERSFRRSGEYALVLQLVARNEEKLTETLTEAQK